MNSTRFHQTIESLLDQAEVEKARTSCVDALAQARAENDRSAEAHAEFGLAKCAYQSHAFGDGMLIASRAIALFSELGLSAEEAQARALVSRVLQISGDLAEAMQEALVALALAERSGEAKAQYAALMSVTNVHIALAQWEPAIAHGERAAELARFMGDELRHGRTLDTLGCAWGDMADEARARGDEERARHCATESIALSQRACEIARRCGNRQLEGTALANAAECVAFLGRLDEAQAMLAAWTLDPERDSAFTATHHLDTWGEIFVRLGKPAEAVELFRRALALAGSQPATMRINAHLADALEQVGDPAGALKHFRRFHSLYVQASSEKAHRIAGVAAVKMRTVAALARAEELSRTNEQLNRRAEDLTKLSLEDPLTTLPNRRALEAALATGELAWAIALIDIDNFKQVNDTYSHMVGDDVLRQVAKLLRACCRGSDMPVRWGGEEFLILLRQLAEGDAPVAAERVRETIEAHDWAGIAPGLSVTVSIGVAEGGATRSIEEALTEADVHLYTAKRGGRNRVVAGPPLETPP